MAAGNETATSFLSAPDPKAPAMPRLVGWLSRHRVWLSLITAIYFVYIVTAHDLMQQPAFWLQDRLGSRERWNNSVTLAGVLVLIPFCIWMLACLWRHPRRKVAVTYLAISIALMAALFHTLIMMNIEIIHYPQYAILAVLLFALTGSYGQTIIWATLAGLADEAYQYFILYPNRRIYMDFNDVILNTVGAGLGLAVLYVCGVFGPRNTASRSIARVVISPAVIGLALFGAAVAYLYGIGRLHLAPLANPSGWNITLRRDPPPTDYWLPLNWGKTFHQVTPIEWVIASIMLILFYAVLDYLTPRESVT